MKKFYNLLLVLSLPALFLLITSEIMYPTGSPGGKTGSPGDNGNNCTDCHSGTATNVDFWIYSPELLTTGYQTNQLYNVIVVGIDENANKFGFEATVEDPNGNKVGAFSADVLGWTQTINNNQSITHTALGTIPIADTGTFWMFTWMSPATTVGDITFYTAVNAANGDGSNSGDQIYLSQFTVSPATGIADQQNSQKFAMYPNPSDGIIHLNGDGPSPDGDIMVMNLSGQMVYSRPAQTGDQKVDLSHLDKGIYVVRVGTKSQRLVLY